MPKLNNHVPKYSRHRASGQAVVTIEGRDIYLGVYGTAASRAFYDQTVAEWIAAGRRLPIDPQAVTVAEVVAAFRRHAKTYYRSADGTVSREVHNIDEALRPLLKLYGRTCAVEFGPLRLKAVRETMIAGGRVRSNINRHVSRLKSVFKWATENELIPPSVFHGLLAVPGLRMGRSEAKESEPVTPVADDVVEKTLPHLSSVVQAIVRVQRLTGARPGEILIMRTADIDQSGEVWTYRPATHKTAHHGHQRMIPLGPQAQAQLRPYLKPLNAQAYIFSPQDAVAERIERMHDARATPLNQGNRPGTNVKAKPKRTPGNRYDVAAYRRAIARACDSAFPPPDELLAPDKTALLSKWRSDRRWHPHQLRHSAATDIRRQFGLEAAQHVLGHATLSITEVYAERNGDVAKRIAAAIG